MNRFLQHYTRRCTQCIPIFFISYLVIFNAMADYQWEGGVTQFGTAVNENSASQASAVNAIYYTSRVVAAEGPLKEAAFIARSTFAGFRYHSRTDSRDELDVAEISTRAFLDNSIFIDLSVSTNNPLNDDDTSERINYSYGAGFYINNNTAISASHLEFEFNEGINPVFERGASSGLDSYTELKIKSVFYEYAAEAHMGLEAFLGWAETDRESSVFQAGILYDYYFHDRFNIGGGLFAFGANGNANAAVTFLLSSEWFLSENLAISANYAITDTDRNLETTTIMVFDDPDDPDEFRLLDIQEVPDLSRIQFFNIGIKARF